MRPHPRIRKTIKWGGAAVTVLLLVVWVVSYRWSPMLHDGGSNVAMIVDGTLTVGTDMPGFPAGFEVIDVSFVAPNHLSWFGKWGWSSDRWGRSIQVPIWTPLVFIVGGTLVAWRLDTLARRHERAHLCPKCNYDRTGLAHDAKCSECGSGETPA